jgi:hypothetical protein
MRAGLLSLDEGLRLTSRLPALAGSRDRVGPLELATLVLAGTAAALLTHLLRLHLGIPGSSIVFAVVPLSLGVALVPRRGAGAVMSASALGVSGVLALAGVRLDGVGAMTSLVVTGPLLDVAGRWSPPGWRLYLGFVLAGVCSNAAAFVVRGTAKALSLGGAAGGAFHVWLPRAIVTYAVAGTVAGLTGAAAWFRLRVRQAR